MRNPRYGIPSTMQPPVIVPGFEASKREIVWHATFDLISVVAAVPHKPEH